MAGANEERTQALADVLRGVLHPERVWREQRSGRLMVFVRHEGQTYCVGPLHYEPPVVG